MKTLIRSSALLLTLSAGLVPALLASPSHDKLVNAYGEPTGFGDESDVIVLDTPVTKFSNTVPGANGLYVLPGYFDPRTTESMGQRHARLAAEVPAGQVTIGTPEVLNSGPTGPMDDTAIDAANDEVTTQVLERIRTTDHLMHSLKQQSAAEDRDSRARFEAAANDVAQRRAALRESLRVVRASDVGDWANARTAVAVSYNAYVQSAHHAEAVASGSVNS